jgi:hypothetical protein
MVWRWTDPWRTIRISGLGIQAGAGARVQGKANCAAGTEAGLKFSSSLGGESSILQALYFAAD